MCSLTKEIGRMDKNSDFLSCSLPESQSREMHWTPVCLWPVLNSPLLTFMVQLAPVNNSREKVSSAFSLFILKDLFFSSHLWCPTTKGHLLRPSLPSPSESSWSWAFTSPSDGASSALKGYPSCSRVDWRFVLSPAISLPISSCLNTRHTWL